jgi:hypothetical protein
MKDLAKSIIVYFEIGSRDDFIGSPTVDQLCLLPIDNKKRLTNPTYPVIN